MPTTATLNDVPYVGVRPIGSYYGFGEPAIAKDSFTFRSRWTTLAFEHDSRRATYNGVLLWLTYPSRHYHGQWMVARRDLEKTFDPLLRPSRALGAEDYRIVVLDPGHGGNDTGAVGRRRVEEKRVVLDVAKRVVKHLEGSGLTVKLTRDADEDVPLPARCKRANAWQADLFVSIHLNSSADRRATGVETYVVTPAGCPSTHISAQKSTYWTPCTGNRHDAANTILGYYLQKNLAKQTQQEDRGLRHARFYVLKEVDCPAALVECGFVSNRREEEKILKRAYRDSIARALADGIREYEKTVKRARLKALLQKKKPQ